MNRGIRLTVIGLAVFVALCTSAEGQWRWTPETGRFVNIGRLPKESPELQIEHARTLLVRGNPKEAMREMDKFVSFYGESEYAAENQFLRGDVRMSQAQFMDAAKEYQQVVVNYPESEFYDRVVDKQYAVADSLFEEGVNEGPGKRKWYLLGLKGRPFRKKPFDQAAEVYSMVIDNQPFSPEAAEAQYKLGQCQFALERYIEAAFEYRRMLEDYRGSEWQADATYGLANCYVKGSLPPEYDQSPSQLATEAIDEFVEAYPNDSRNGELRGLQNEMNEKIARQRLSSAMFYEKRDILKSARIYYEVVVEQFGETGAAEEARAWLAEHPAG